MAGPRRWVVRLAQVVALGAALAASLGARRVMTDDAGGRGPEPKDPYAAERKSMVFTQLERRGIRSGAVLRAMEKVPRHRFVPENLAQLAYEDGPLPIGYGQTISQPYIVALMTEALEITPRERVLEVGTGSGYQTAVLAELAQEVFTIEIVEPLGRGAQARLRELGYSNVHVRIGDGYQGWTEHAPYDAIIVTAAPEHVPEPLLAQLKIGGRLVIPLGRQEQDLILLRKTKDGVKRRTLSPVRFVPMTGEAGETVH
jgi:protein-L-isoaspartate(D-aspartate) O-methyltransferase